jgi:hypothetical protein
MAIFGHNLFTFPVKWNQFRDILFSGQIEPISPENNLRLRSHKLINVLANLD